MDDLFTGHPDELSMRRSAVRASYLAVMYSSASNTFFASSTYMVSEECPNKSLAVDKIGPKSRIKTTTRYVFPLEYGD